MEVFIDLHVRSMGPISEIDMVMSKVRLLLQQFIYPSLRFVIQAARLLVAQRLRKDACETILIAFMQMMPSTSLKLLSRAPQLTLTIRSYAQSYSMDCYFRQEWHDKRLAYNSSWYAGNPLTLVLSISMLNRYALRALSPKVIHHRRILSTQHMEAGHVLLQRQRRVPAHDHRAEQVRAHSSRRQSAVLVTHDGQGELPDASGIVPDGLATVSTRNRQL